MVSTKLVCNWMDYLIRRTQIQPIYIKMIHFVNNGDGLACVKLTHSKCRMYACKNFNHLVTNYVLHKVP